MSLARINDEIRSSISFRLAEPGECAGVDSVLPTPVVGTLGVRLAALASPATPPDPRMWREPFVQLAEMLAVPGRFAVTVRQASRRDDDRGLIVISDLVVTCFGDSSRDVMDELVQVGEQVQMHLGGPHRPYWVTFLKHADMEWPSNAGGAMLIRQQTAEVVTAAGPTELPLRFNPPGPGAAARLIQTISAFGGEIDIFVSLTPTRLRAEEERWLARLGGLHGEHLEQVAPVAARAVATAIDLEAVMRTQTFVLQLLVASSVPLGAAVRQAIASAFTASFDTERWGSARVVARPDRFMGGGFEIEPVRDPEMWLGSMARGVPVLGCHSPRTLCDLVSSTEVEYVFGWAGDALGRVPGVPVSNGRAVEVPGDPGAVVLGTDPFGVQIRLPERDRHLHTIVMSSTGGGKTTFMAALAAQDVAAGRSVIAVDPHGDLLYRICDAVPTHRRRDVRILDASEGSKSGLQYLTTFEDRASQEMVDERVIEGMTADLPEQYSGPVFVRIMKSSFHAARGAGRPISSIPETFIKGFDPVAAGYDMDDLATSRHFQEIASWSDVHRAEMLTYISSKFNCFLTGSVRSTFDAPFGASLNDVLAGSPILLVRPSAASGTARVEMGMFLGAVMAVLSGRKPESPTIGLYLDEAHIYGGATLRRLMNESRKLAVAVHACTQSMSNLGSSFEAFAGNAGTVAIGRTTAGTASFASALLDVPQRTLERLPNLSFVVRPTVCGTPRGAISCQIEAPATVPVGFPGWVLS